MATSARPVKHVVVDANGFIRNAPIREIGDEVYTIAEVVHETCDRATRKRLQVLPYTLNFKKPSADAVLAVSDFAKKTGDYRHLSAVDISVLALTYMLEKEHEGLDNIRKEPVNKAAEYVVPSKTTNNRQATIAGFYSGKGGDKATDSADNPGADVSSDTNTDSLGDKPCSETISNNNEEISKPKPDEKSNADEQEHLNGDKDASDKSENLDSEDVLPESMLEEEEESEEEEIEEDDDDDGGWITPSNIREVKRQFGTGVLESEETCVTVACLTTDFAMQNVLIQMGLNVISVDGMLIKRAKSYVLRCFGCMKITYNLDKVFCPNCGNRTLKRVAMTRDEDGQVHYYFSRRPLNTRGMKYPLPQPKGGKHSNNPTLFEDQPLPQQRLSRKAKEKVDVFDQDWVTGSSPFAVHDVTSRASKVGISGKHDFRNSAYWNKRNPNEARKRHGKKK